MLRSSGERMFQSLCYELFALVLAIPLYAVLVGVPLEGGALVLCAVMLAEMLCGPVHNWAFDAAEARRTGRLASDRTPRWRVVHAVSYEVTMSLISVPILMGLGGHGLLEALALDIMLSVVYVGYALIFHLVYDWWRPVRPAAVAGAAR